MMWTSIYDSLRVIVFSSLLETVGDVLGKHDASPSTSSQKVDLSKITVITAEKEDREKMIQVHGAVYRVGVLVTHI